MAGSTNHSAIHQVSRFDLVCCKLIKTVLEMTNLLEHHIDYMSMFLNFCSIKSVLLTKCDERARNLSGVNNNMGEES